MKHSVVEQEPAEAAALCGGGISLVRQFAVNLGTHGEVLGLIGPDEAGRLWSRHLLNCALLAPELDRGVELGDSQRLRVADVGSGAGLPGLVLAMIRPDCDFVLIEPLERRTRWLREQVAELGLPNVEVFTGRAEEYPEKRSFDVVTARAVKALKGLIPWLEPLVVDDGRVLLLKGQRVDDEIAEAQKVLAKHHVSKPRTAVLGLGIVAEPTRLFAATVER
ncbi:MAG: 16S rRNA (guanine(527)-N(7))-methyltransferase RsmG [Microbacteriaceae bacterium]